MGKALETGSEQGAQKNAQGERRPIQIAIDGPAGAGKSSVSKALAARLGCIHLDTGAMYRAVTWLALKRGVAFDDDAAMQALLNDLQLEFQGQRLFCNGEDVTEAIRENAISANASAVATLPRVREAMVAQQRRIAAGQDVLMDGRDIGTTVLPDAQFKFFLTASLQERAKRRYLELKEKGEEVDLAKLEQEIAQRDEQDSHRAVSPLMQAEDAELVDTTDLTFDEVVEKLFHKIQK